LPGGEGKGIFFRGRALSKGERTDEGILNEFNLIVWPGGPNKYLTWSGLVDSFFLFLPYLVFFLILGLTIDHDLSF